jgi:hypothetical protein
MNRWWSLILASGGTDPLGQLLAQHPEASRRTQRLLSELTVVKLIRIANAEYNYCRIGRDISVSGETFVRSEQAWQTLDHKVRTLSMRDGTAWTRTVSLLTDGADEGIAAVRQLPIDRVIVACEKLIKGPYTRMTKSQAPPRW